MIKLTKEVSGYLPPEDGPFECEGCHYFSAPRKCELVEGTIDPEGCCNLFTPLDNGEDETEDTDDTIEIDSDDEDSQD